MVTHQTGPDTLRGRAVLMLGHFAGMIDLVALPVWMGVLVQSYAWDLEHAGMAVSAFLVGAVAASLFAAPRFNRLPRRACAVGGYALAAAAFGAASQAESFAQLLPLHLLAGLSVGVGLSITHGTIGRSSNPHRLFGIAGASLGIGGVLFYAAVPPAILAHGGHVLFFVFAGLMLAAALACTCLPEVAKRENGARNSGKLTRATWFAILGVACMALNQSMVFSMLDRIGVMRGFGQDRVNGLLLVCGLVNLVPAVLATLLQHRLPAYRVAVCAPLVQAALALMITLASAFGPYALAASVYAFVMIFAHTFLFGLIARLDTSGRAVAATPAMMMTGAALGPALAGIVATRAGFGGIGILAVIIAVLAVAMFARVRHQPQLAASTAA
jgi:predicted MFS family arabinose efflux permease